MYLYYMNYVHVISNYTLISNDNTYEYDLIFDIKYIPTQVYEGNITILQY